MAAKDYYLFTHWSEVVMDENMIDKARVVKTLEWMVNTLKHQNLARFIDENLEK